mmetsp:Transcript_7276/g.14437  ORF Transcript_7276/g.14437 Transcript_7276/m.14437 type:complete len:246 (-) Transcript_7276:617-1354(-)|eukprot:CAMPEP_0181300820 /NCGR_PEP_ID=MMETSP1101-20121128/7092_1 /TAXON_ID=46948 /ORGANISM="Rhodomonas abbreviata, Strain Caron Lab Isolate" /LENGTH=245 /DNA_ID=CAMNT_0023406079 /DNA_START=49 /DNA_END=786 /DNA_ORIENTATION=-
MLPISPNLTVLFACVFACSLPTSSAFLHLPAAGRAHLAPCFSVLGCTLSNRLAGAHHKKPALALRMTSSSPQDDVNADSKPSGDALVTPPSSSGQFDSPFLLPPPAQESNFDFVTDMIVGKLQDEADGVPLDGNVDSEPISVPVGGGKVELGEVVKPMMSMIFTCNVCETRQMRSFSKLAYEKGIVIVNCKGCKYKHLIADNIGWYRDWLHKGDQNVEDMMKRKGVDVPRLGGEDAMTLYEEWKE